MSSWAYYSATRAGFKLVATLAIAGFMLLPRAQPAELIVESGPGHVAGVHWESLRLDLHVDRPTSDWTLLLGGLTLEETRALGELKLTCLKAPQPVTSGCEDGRLEWRIEDPELSLSVSFVHRRESGVHQASIHDDHWRLELNIPEDDPEQFSGKLAFDRLDLSELPSMLARMLDLDLLYGVLSGDVLLESERLTARLSIVDGGFDGLEGQAAADGLSLDVDLAADMTPMPESVSLELTQTAGELLIGSLYLPSPEAPLHLRIESHLADGSLDLSRFSLIDPDALEVSGSGRLVQGAEGWQVERLELESAEIHLPLGWARWMDGHSAAAGFADLVSAGRIRAHLDWEKEQPINLQAELIDVSFEDPRERLAVSDINGRLDWGRFGPGAELSWDSLGLFGLQMGRSELSMFADESGVHLDRPLRLPLLDGAFVIEQLVWAPQDEAQPGFGLDARIEPLSLSDLTRALGWPEFGGTLSGEFPGVMFVDDQFKVTGGIDIQAFSGRIQLTDLAIERPFGTLPALAAQVEFSRLDLLELTGAFNFGRMEGQLSGWMRDLRLLDWRPVAMDARVFTHEDARRRRISQRAVENLSDLGGAGGALMTGTVLRVFEDFPYRRAGLACRLSNNICYIDGVAPHESGGFYIVEGRALPRLDIVGHRRLVDWPRLMAQLAAMVE
jgi:hypothetical protein